MEFMGSLESESRVGVCGSWSREDTVFEKRLGELNLLFDS